MLSHEVWCRSGLVPQRIRAQQSVPSPDIESSQCVVLQKVNSLAVDDISMTPTAELADVFCQQRRFLEQTYYASYEDSGYAHPTLPALSMLRPEVVPPHGESWPDWKIIFELGRRLGYGDYVPGHDIEQAI
jgi:anaerobic selenocysteine-containing dehydrogenase